MKKHKKNISSILLLMLFQTTRMIRIYVSVCFHDDVIKWKHFLRYWYFVRWNRRSPVNFPRKGQWRGALILICTWTNGGVNNRDAGDLRRNCAHYDVTVMNSSSVKSPLVNKTILYWGNGLSPVRRLCWLNVDADKMSICTLCNKFQRNRNSDLLIEDISNYIHYKMWDEFTFPKYRLQYAFVSASLWAKSIANKWLILGFVRDCLDWLLDWGGTIVTRNIIVRSLM